MGTPLILADDLSGAAETAAALGADLASELFLWPDIPAGSPAHPVVIDLDSRHLPAAQATARVADALRALTAPAPLFKKIDSLLRGNVAAEVAPLVDANALVIFTPALPQQGRTVVQGVLLHQGVPLDQTDLWALEPTAPPATVVDALPGLPAQVVALDSVRSDGLTEALAGAVAKIAVCDAETQADLDAIVTAGLAAGTDVRFVGSSDFARALGPHLPRPALPAAAPRGSRMRRGVLYILGTGAPPAVAQADLLAAQVGAVRRPLSAPTLSTLDAEAAAQQGRALASELEERDVIVQVSASTDPTVDGAVIVAGLAALVAATIAAAPDWPVRMLLTGGQTARAVLDQLGCRRLTLLREIHPGAVLMSTDSGWLVATRPGSHGGPDSLVAIHQAISNPDPITQEDS